MPGSLSQRQSWWPLARRSAALLIALCCLACGPPALASSLALVSDNGAKKVALFNADLDTVTARRDAAPGRASGDCALSSDESLGFSSGSGGEITVLDIDGVTAGFGGPVNHVSISNLGVDMSLNPDETFLVLAGGGALLQPLSVVDTGLRVEVATAGPFIDHTSVEFCDDGTLLITTSHGRYYGPDPDNALYDASVDRQGNISLGGKRVASGAQPNNSACAPGSKAAVMLDRAGGLTSFTLPGFEVADRASTSNSAAAVSAVFSRDGKRLYVRSTDTVEAFDFDPASGVMTPDWVTDAPGSLAFFGIDQIALHPAGNKLYVDGGESVLILDPGSGNRSGSIPLGDTTGICFAKAPRIRGKGRIVRNSAPTESPSP